MYWRIGFSMTPTFSVLLGRSLSLGNGRARASLTLSLAPPYLSIYTMMPTQNTSSRLLNSTLSVYCVAATFLARTYRSTYDHRECPTSSRPAPVERECQRRSRSAPVERERFLEHDSKFRCHRKTGPPVQIFLKRIDRHNGSIPG